MPIILLHGAGLLGILNKTYGLKKQFDPMSITELSGKDMDFQTALVNLSTASFFADNRLVILENFEDLDLEKIPDVDKLTLILKFTKQLPANSRILKAASSKKMQIILFSEKEETNIFPFLDLLSEKNKKAFSVFEKNYEEWSGQYILTMIFYMLRRLILPSKNAPAFVIQKLEKQKRNFSLGEIKSLYKLALETDFKFKSGLIEEKLGLTLLINKILA